MVICPGFSTGAMLAPLTSITSTSSYRTGSRAFAHSARTHGTWSTAISRTTQTPSSALRSYLSPCLTPHPQHQQLRALTLSTLPRPSLRRTILECPSTPSIPPTPQSTTSSLGAAAGVLPLMLVRGAKRDTYDPSVRVRKRRHGWLSRIRTRLGRKLLARRRAKGRMNLSH